MFYKAERTPAIEAAIATDAFQKFLEFVQYPIWITEPAVDIEHGTRVAWWICVFGTPSAPGFQAVATITDRNQVANSSFTLARPDHVDILHIDSMNTLNKAFLCVRVASPDYNR